METAMMRYEEVDTENRALRAAKYELETKVPPPRTPPTWSILLQADSTPTRVAYTTHLRWPPRHHCVHTCFEPDATVICFSSGHRAGAPVARCGQWSCGSARGAGPPAERRPGAAS